MTLVVEDGTGLANAESYVSTTTFSEYAGRRGLTFNTDDPRIGNIEAALVRATEYIDPHYRGRFPGYQAQGRAQSLEWPRIGAYVIIPDDGRSDAFYYANRRDYFFLNGIYYIQPNIVPPEIIKATCEAAIRELATPGVLTPDLTREDLVTKFSVGPVSFDYSSNARDNTIFQRLDYVLRALLLPSNAYSGRVSR